MALENYVTAIHADWYGNGRAGWKERICTFIDKFEAVEDEREKTQSLRHAENSEKMDNLATATAQAANKTAEAANKTQAMIFVVLLLTLVVAVIAAAIGYIEGKRAGLIPQNIFPADKKSQVYDAKESPPLSALDHVR